MGTLGMTLIASLVLGTLGISVIVSRVLGLSEEVIKAFWELVAIFGIYLVEEVNEGFLADSGVLEVGAVSVDFSRLEFSVAGRVVEVGAALIFWLKFSVDGGVVEVGTAEVNVASSESLAMFGIFSTEEVNGASLEFLAIFGIFLAEEVSVAIS